MSTSKENLALLFCGDFSPVRRFESMVLEKGRAIFGDLQETIEKSDIAFLNLEAPLSLRGKAVQKTNKPGVPGLRANPKCIKAVAEAGFDVVSLANNHAMDFGPVALADTMDQCRSAGLAACGAGENLAAARQPVMLERKGIKIAILAVAEHQFGVARENSAGVAPLDVIDNLSMLEQARACSDLVFVSIHGGNDFFEYPRPDLRRICRFYADRGADAVVCHHSHKPGAYELYKGKPIVYGLGNLIFDHLHPPAGWSEGYALKLEYSATNQEFLGFDIIPYSQSLEQGGLELKSGDLYPVFMSNLEALRKNVESNLAFEREWQAFCESQSAFAIMRSYSPIRPQALYWLDRHFSIHKWLLPKSVLNFRLNAIRCESHRELLISVLENKRKSVS